MNCFPAILPITVPTAVVTATFLAPIVVLAGVTMVIWVGEFTTKLVTLTPLTVTTEAPEKLVPVIMEVVPPASGPEAAVATEVIVAAWSHCAYKMVFDVITKVEPARYWVPLPRAAVFHPAKVKVVLTSVPTNFVVTLAR